jgi:hypothetical protein
VAEGYLSPGDVRVCMGDSAWSPGQLEGEVAAGMWAVVRWAATAARPTTLRRQAGRGWGAREPFRAFASCRVQPQPAAWRCSASSSALLLCSAALRSEPVPPSLPRRVAPDFLDVFGPAAAAASTLDASAGSGGDNDGPAAAYEGGMWSKCLGCVLRRAGLPCLPAAAQLRRIVPPV